MKRFILVGTIDEVFAVLKAMGERKRISKVTMNGSFAS